MIIAALYKKPQVCIFVWPHKQIIFLAKISWFSYFLGTSSLNGAVAQLGERYNGIVEVVGSIPIGSTISKIY